MTERLDVQVPARLQAFLRDRLDGWSGKTLKDRLRRGCVQVNGETVTRHDHPLERGDRVEVLASSDGRSAPRGREPFTTLYADEDLVVIDKPEGLLSVSTDRQRTRTALALLRTSLSSPGRRASLWPVHRLDRETSGVLLFARSREVRDALQSSWADTEKVYLAVVEGQPRPPDGVVDEPLWEDRHLNVRVGARPGAKDARTAYRTRECARRRALLEVELFSGRRHQIRAHLAWLGHPVVGDRRYGSPAARMGLHAARLCVTHPHDGRRLELEAPAPRELAALLGGSR